MASTADHGIHRLTVADGSRRLEDKLEPQLKKLLQSAGADEYLTMFASGALTLKQVLYMDDTDLLEVSGPPRG